MKAVYFRTSDNLVYERTILQKKRIYIKLFFFIFLIMAVAAILLINISACKGDTIFLLKK